MAQQDATRVVRESIEAFNAGDWQRFRGTLTPDSVYEELGTQRRITQVEEQIKAAQAWKQAFPDAKGTVRSMTTSGNTVVAEILWEGTHRGALQGPGGTIPASGKRARVPAAYVCTVQGGKIKENHHYFDLMTLLQQIGAVPAPRA